jgi:protein-tyrosine phosphatase
MALGESVTPKTDIPFNFGRASARDHVLYTCERPGGDPDIGVSKISLDKVQPQVDFMKDKGISQVLILLDDNEMEHYETPDLLLKAYQAADIETHRQPMGEPGAAANILKIIKGCEEQENVKIAAHCTHGMGRSGRVAAAWLSDRYQLTPNDATDEALEYAREMGIERLGNTGKLESWME